MLVLSRKAQQRILIGKDIQIIVVEITKNRVRLAVSAPKHIKVLRDELPRRNAEEKQSEDDYRQSLANEED